jgi:hypothetical protein
MRPGFGVRIRVLMPLCPVAALCLLIFTIEAARGETSTGNPRSEESLASPDDDPSVTRAKPGTDTLDPGPLPPPLPAPAYADPGRIVNDDRWRIIESLGVNSRWYDPYHQNTLKGDRPVLFLGRDWFVNVTLISDTLVESRRLPTPVGIQQTHGGGSLDAFSGNDQLLTVENVVTSFSLIKGDTVFRPPDYEFRITPVFNWNYARARERGVLDIDPERGRTRFDDHVGFQELFVDKHLYNIDDRYDFVSVRAGIQNFDADFRGFLFLDNEPGVRLFGNYANNRLQYNVAWFRRLDKDVNSGLNGIFPFRNDDVFIVNSYVQDAPVPGFTTQGTVVYNRNREGDRSRKFDENGFLQRPAPVGSGRPHDYDVVYLGLNGDGHFGPCNLTMSGYWALGSDRPNPIANRTTDVNARFVAAEPSMDFDWLRLKAFGLYASGDHDPFDGHANGFDAIFENPQFGGGDTSFFQRQAIPFIGGGGVVLSARNALLPALRTSKEQGQSNFVNPGLVLLGGGADFDVLPELRVLADVSWLSFDNTATLRVLRNQGPIANHIGEDVSLALVYRPLFTNNVIVRVAGAVLIPGKGLNELFDDRNGKDPFYSTFTNVTFTY